jgi:natural product precursor
MKKRDFNKKLVLNKNTVANLDLEELHSIKGGTDVTIEWTICRTRCVSECVSCDTVMHRTCPD